MCGEMSAVAAYDPPGAVGAGVATSVVRDGEINACAEGGEASGGEYRPVPPQSSDAHSFSS